MICSMIKIFKHEQHEVFLHVFKDNSLAFTQAYILVISLTICRILSLRLVPVQKKIGITSKHYCNES